MKRPKPYFVAVTMTTPDEPHQGWYFTTENDDADIVFHGQFSVKMDAEEAIDDVMFNAGQIGS